MARRVLGCGRCWCCRMGRRLLCASDLSCLEGWWDNRRWNCDAVCCRFALVHVSCVRSLATGFVLLSKSSHCGPMRVKTRDHPSP